MLTVERLDLLDRSGTFDGGAVIDLVDAGRIAMGFQGRPRGFAQNELLFGRGRRLIERQRA